MVLAKYPKPQTLNFKTYVNKLGHKVSGCQYEPAGNVHGYKDFYAESLARLPSVQGLVPWEAGSWAGIVFQMITDHNPEMFPINPEAFKCCRALKSIPARIFRGCLGFRVDALGVTWLNSYRLFHGPKRPIGFRF